MMKNGAEVSESGRYRGGGGKGRLRYQEATKAADRNNQMQIILRLILAFGGMNTSQVSGQRVRVIGETGEYL